jgi:hypothetical protein
VIDCIYVSSVILSDEKITRDQIRVYFFNFFKKKKRQISLKKVRRQVRKTNNESIDTSYRRGQEGSCLCGT